MKKTGQGLGLNELFKNYSSEITTYDSTGVLNKGVEELDINLIRRNPDQPRKDFDEEKLNELATSIKSYGIIQPISVVKRGDYYIIIAGERRYRAAQIAGLDKVPVIVRDYDEQKCQEVALIENLQREDLNPIEEAIAYKDLISSFGITQEEIAEKFGKSRPTITNSIRLLNLPEEVQELVREGSVTTGHAKLLLEGKVRNDKEIQIRLAKEVAKRKLSVRSLAIMINTLNKTEKVATNTDQSDEIKELVTSMDRVFGTKTKIVGNEKKGRIYIDYYKQDDLNRIYDLIMKLLNDIPTNYVK